MLAKMSRKWLLILLVLLPIYASWILILLESSSPTESHDPHKGEGFLKSAWHKLTNAAHMGTGSAGDEGKKETEKNEEGKKSDSSGDNNGDNKKKSSDSS